MSKSLYWRPAPVRPEGESLSLALRHILGLRLWGDETPPLGAVRELDIDVPGTAAYLEDLADAGTEDAAELLAALRKHRRIELWVDE